AVTPRKQFDDGFRALVAMFFQRMHAGPRGRRQRRFGPRKQRRHHDEYKHGRRGDPNIDRQDAALAVHGLNPRAQFVVEKGAHSFRLDVSGDETLADVSRENEGQRAAPHFLVLRHGRDDFTGSGAPAWNLADTRHQPYSAQMLFDPLRRLRQAKPLRGGKTEGAGHPDRHAFAMDQPGAVVADELFQSMAESVAEIEKRAVALLGLVARHYGGLGFATDRNGVVKFRPTAENRRPMVLQPGEKIRPVDQAIFDHFGIAGGEFARRQ